MFIIKYKILETFNTNECTLSSYFIVLSCPFAIQKYFLNNVQLVILWTTARQNWF